MRRIVVHHTNNDKTVLENEEKQKGRGYAALGYHFFIAKDGKIYEGRPLEVMGSHAGSGKTPGPTNDPDWGSIGIVLQGDYHHDDDWISSSTATDTQLALCERCVRRRPDRMSATCARAADRLGGKAEKRAGPVPMAPQTSRSANIAKAA
ncbi:MAG: peptidoglycan recognition family protein [Pseudomonadota bacterium]